MDLALSTKRCGICSTTKVTNPREVRDEISRMVRRLDERNVVEAKNAELKRLAGVALHVNSPQLTAARSQLAALKLQKRDMRERVQDLRKALVAESAAASGEQLQLKGLEGSTREMRERGQLSAAVVEGLQHDLKEKTKELYFERMRRALESLRMMALSVQLPRRGTGTKRAEQVEQVELTGVSSILSVPLPNSGIFAGTPIDVVTSALAHVAHALDACSAALNLPLLHPTQPFLGDCLITAAYDTQQVCYSLTPARYMHPLREARRFCWTTLHELRKETYAPGARGSGRGVRGPTQTSKFLVNRDFPTALRLLQENVVALCATVGIQPEALWPPQALLLNLHELREFMKKQVRLGLGNTPGLDFFGSPLPGPALPFHDAELERLRNKEVLLSLVSRHRAAALATAAVTDGEWDLVDS